MESHCLVENSNPLQVCLRDVHAVLKLIFRRWCLLSVFGLIACFLHYSTQESVSSNLTFDIFVLEHHQFHYSVFYYTYKNSMKSNQKEKKTPRILTKISHMLVLSLFFWMRLMVFKCTCHNLNY